MTNEGESAALKYALALVDLAVIRARHGGAESPEEDAHLERLDLLWRRMTPAERKTP